MRKLSKVLAVSAVIFAVLVYAWPYIKMNFAGSAHYTEQNKREYDFYTPEILKKIPRISRRYTFDFVNVTGPAAHVYAVKFYDTEDSSEIDAWLFSIGYKPLGICNIDNACWRGQDPDETVMIRPLKSEKGLAVQVVYDFNR